MPSLTLERAGVVVDLDRLIDSAYGAQAVAGLTGFGLPPVSVQWSEGAGDGATYQGRRIAPRDIDLPLHIAVPDRLALQAYARDLSIVLDGEATLRVSEDVRRPASPEVVLRRNLARDPRPTTLAGTSAWSAVERWFGGGMGSFAIRTGPTPLSPSRDSTYIEKRWSTDATSNSSTGFTAGSTLAVVAGETYAISAYLYNDSATPKVATVRTLASPGFVTTDGELFTLPPRVWTRVSRVYTVPSGTTSLAPDVTPVQSTPTWVAGDGLFGTGLLVEKAGTIGDYFDGDTPGCRWDVTAPSTAAPLVQSVLLRQQTVSVSRSTKVVRVGGGDFATGTDTDGKTFLRSVVTLRAGSPFWESSETAQVDYPLARNLTTDPDFATYTVTNPGAAEAFPVWEITGPTLGFTLSSPSGESLAFLDFIGKGKKIIVDSRAGTVVDETGTNRYESLGPAPRFFALPPGPTTFRLAADQTSAAFAGQNTAGRRNLIVSPDGRSSTGWTLGTNWALSGGVLQRPATSAVTGTVPTSLSYAVSGLTVGQPYKLSADVTSAPQATQEAAFRALSNFGSVVARSYSNALMRITCGPGTPTEIQREEGTDVRRMEWTFVARATTALLEFVPDRQYGYSATGAFIGHASGAMSVDNVYVGLPGAPFTGDTPATGQFLYSWAGAAGASQSIEANRETDVAGSNARLTFTPRDWMVV
jgi:hypothetical protein